MIPVFVISLPEETARRAAMTAHMSARGLDFTFFDAVDGRAMNVLAHPDYDSATRRRAHGRDLKPGELGCFLSHRAVYEHIVHENLDYALIVEDDARFSEDARAVLESLLAQKFPFDLVRLLGSPKVARKKHRKILKLYGNHFLVRLLTTPGGAHATLVSRAGAARLLKHLKRITYPIDTVLGRTWETGLQVYSIQPGLAVQDLSFDSAIGESRFDKTDLDLGGFEKTLFPLTRALFKLGETFGKRWVFWANALTDHRVRTKNNAAP